MYVCIERLCMSVVRERWFQIFARTQMCARFEKKGYFCAAKSLYGVACAQTIYCTIASPDCNRYMYIYIHIHTYIHTYLSQWPCQIVTYTYIYIHKYIHKYIYIYAYIHTYIHTYIHQVHTVRIMMKSWKRM